MNNYYDKFGRIHHKPCINLEPSSNNGWIYSAFAHKVGVPVDMNLIGQCYNDCRVYYEAKGDYILNRHPGKSSVPISRDEVLGMVSLGFLKHKKDVVIGWNFCPFIIPRFSALSLIKQLWEMRPSLVNTWQEDEKGGFYHKWEYKHRNYFWQNNLDQLYRFAFSVPVQDRYFMLKTWNSFKWYKPSHILYLTIAKIDAKLNPSGIRFLKYGGEKNLNEMVKEFPADHPIRVKTGL